MTAPAPALSSDHVRADDQSNKSLTVTSICRFSITIIIEFDIYRAIKQHGTSRQASRICSKGGC